MKVYLAGEQFANVRDSVRRRLFSYWYNRTDTSEMEYCHGKGQDLFLDSGAFTAFTRGVCIDLEEYAKFITDHGHLFGPIANLDSIDGGAEQSWRNLKELEILGVNPCPVFHQGEPEEFLLRMLEEYDYIFIGGMVGGGRGSLQHWLDRIWSKYLVHPDGTPRVRLHGFGLTDQVLMFRYPWHSVDSTSWLFTEAFGGCLFYRNGKAIKIVFSTDSPSAKKLNAPFYSNLSEIEKRYVDEWLSEMGVTAEQCASSYAFRNVINADSFQRMEADGARTFIQQELSIF